MGEVARLPCGFYNPGVLSKFRENIQKQVAMRLPRVSWAGVFYKRRIPEWHLLGSGTKFSFSSPDRQENPANTSQPKKGEK